VNFFILSNLHGVAAFKLLQFPDPDGGRFPERASKRKSPTRGLQADRDAAGRGQGKAKAEHETEPNTASISDANAIAQYVRDIFT
jgi:hypothetical protein